MKRSDRKRVCIVFGNESHASINCRSLTSSAPVQRSVFNQCILFPQGFSYINSIQPWPSNTDVHHPAQFATRQPLRIILTAVIDLNIVSRYLPFARCLERTAPGLWSHGLRPSSASAIVALRSSTISADLRLAGVSYPLRYPPRDALCGFGALASRWCSLPLRLLYAFLN